MKKLVSLYKYLIYSISFFFLLFFSWFSLISISTLNPIEHIYFVDISGKTGIVVLAILVLLFMIPPVRKAVKKFEGFLEMNSRIFHLLYWSLLLCILVIGVTWVCVTRFDSWSDSLSVQMAANNLLAGDYTDYLPGGYVDTWNNQIGLLLLEAVVFKMFGTASPLLFQIFNSVCMVFIFVALSEFTEKRLQKMIVLLFGIVWFPMIISASHIYGNTPGLTFALWGFVLLFRFKEKTKLVYGILSVLCMAFACLIKENYLIFVIAYVLSGTVMAIKDKKAKTIVTAICTMCVTFAFL